MNDAYALEQLDDAGEDNTNQAGFNTAALFGVAAGSGSFDEILFGTDAAAIAGIFIV